jgi:hypothetical protein
LDIWVEFKYWFFKKKYRKINVILVQGPGQMYHYKVELKESAACCPSGETCLPIEELGPELKNEGGEK